MRPRLATVALLWMSTFAHLQRYRGYRLLLVHETVNYKAATDVLLSSILRPRSVLLLERTSHQDFTPTVSVLHAGPIQASVEGS